MRPLSSSSVPALVALGLLVGSAGARAQTEVSATGSPVESEQKAVGEYWQARLRYGVSYRTGVQGDPRVDGLSYDGLTPNDPGLEAWGWYKYFGGTVALDREGFSLNDKTSGTRVTQGGVLRAHLAATGRIPLGPLRLEPIVGYQYAQLPTFDLVNSVAFGTASRHGLLLAARVLVDVGPVTVEARGAYPLALSTSLTGARSARSSGFQAGGGVRVQVFNTGSLHFGLMLDAAYVSDSLTTVDQNDVSVSSSQSAVRGGLSVDVQWKDPATGPKFGGVLVTVVDADTLAPLDGAQVWLGVGGQRRAVSPDGTGALAARELPPGPFTVTATVGGYLPYEGAGEVAAGVDVPIALKLKKQPPKVGALHVLVVELDSNKPLAGATVVVGEVTVTTDAVGTATVDHLKPGPVGLSVSLAKYQNGDEAASIVAGKTASVTVALVPEKQRVPASITGLVRSTKGGAPIAADLEIPQVKIKTHANDRGAFTFRVEGGTYTVKVSAPGYITQTKQLAVKDGDQAIFNIDLYPK